MDTPRSECRVTLESLPLESNSGIEECIGIASIAATKSDEERAAANIAEWRKYLPPDCIDSMIKDGSDRTV